jgi:ketosteroid isomerase-like protein
MATVGDDYEARTRALWDAYTRGDADAACALLDEEIEWRVSTGELLRGRTEVAAYLRRHADTLQAVAHAFEREGDCVVVHGSLRRFREGGFLDVQPSWVHCFRDGRLVSLATYESRAEARSAIEDFEHRTG